VNPAVAVFLGWTLGREVLTGRELLASATIIAGVALIITAKTRSQELETGNWKMETRKHCHSRERGNPLSGSISGRSRSGFPPSRE